MLLTVFIRFEINAQEGNACGMPPPPGGESCTSSCVYCDFDGYMGINNGTPSGGASGCPGISIHNDQWFGFTAGTTELTLDIITSNCQNGDGLQAAFMDNCGDGTAIACEEGCDDCGDQTFTLSYSGFEVGQTYWLMIDGYIGDICNFEIDFVSGSITAPPADPPLQPVGPTVVCPGATVVYSVPDAFGAGFYHWTAPPGSSINGLSNNVNVNAPDGTQVTVTFGSLGGQVCVQTGNSCNPVTPFQCLNVVNMAIPPTIKPKLVICNDDLPFTWDEEPFPILTASGTFTLNSTPYDSYLGCDSIVRQVITVKPPLMSTLPIQYLCAGTCFSLAGIEYCDPGPFTIVLPSFQGCDSTISSAISILNPVAQIAGNTPITCATQGGLNLSATNFAVGSSFQWTNANWTLLGGANIQNVTSTGIYHLVVSSIGGGVVCRDTAQVLVTGNTTPPGATATGGNINCISTSATLLGSSGTSGVNYLWTGPGITPANQNAQNPTVSLAGTYILTVTNPVNNCTSTASVTVMADNTPPQALATNGEITCTQSSFTIDGTTNIPNPVWNWAGPGINASNQTVENPNVAQPGSYAVTVTNNLNGCSNTALATVNLNTNIPTATAGTDQTLTCLLPNVNLQGSGNTGLAPMGVVWTGPNSFSATTLNPSVNQAGLYILTITNQQNGCVKADSVDIASNQVLPIALAGTDSTITCDHPSVTLIGSGSSNGAIYTPQWTGPGINASNQNQYNPVVNLNGTYTLLMTNTTSGCSATDVVLVDIDIAQPVSNAGLDQLLTCTSQNGVTLNGSGTPANVAYFWSGPGIGANNETQQTPTVTQAGLYTLLVTNPVNGCTHTDQVDITQDANVPSADGGLDHTLNCTVNTVDFDASGSSSGPGITYTWTGPGISGANSTAQNPTGITMPGTYNFTVFNANNNCTNTDVVVVIQDTQLPTASAGADLILNCFNNAIDTLNGSGSSVGSIYTYLWSGPGIVAGDENLQNPVVNNQPGMYSLTVTNTDNTCVDVDQVTVVSDLTAPTAAAGADNTIDCVVTSIAIGGASSAGPSFSYLWNGPDITPANETLAMPTVSQSGTYTIIVTSSINGCTQSDDVLVNTNAVYPTVAAGADGLLTCTQLNAVLDGSASSTGVGFNVLWTGPGISPANQAQTTPTVTVPGTYILSIINTTNSCSEVDTVVVDQNIIVPGAVAGNDQHLDCQTTAVVLDGSFSDVSPTITYLWTGVGITPGSETQQSPTVSQLGNYTLLVTDTDNGCSQTDDVIVTQDIAQPTANAGTDLLITCANTTQSIDGSGSSTGVLFEYVWQGPGINTNNFGLQNPMVADSGTYMITVTNIQNHCTDTDLVYVDMDQELPITAAGPDRTLSCTTTSVQLDASLSQSGANISFLWSGPGILPGQETSSMPMVNAPGAYNVTVTNALNGCSNTDFASVGEDILPPNAAAGTDLVITCANSNIGVVINSTGSSVGPTISYLWTGPGITPANATVANPSVLVAGAYTLVVTNATNGCTASSSMSVSLDQDLPTPSAGIDQTITCDILTVTLDATASTSQGGTLGYTWTGPGITAANVNSSTPDVTVSGTYTVTVLNSISGCQASDQVVVLLDNTAPTLTTTTDIITCQDPNGSLSVSSSLPGSTYHWEGPNVSAFNASLAAFSVTVAGSYNVTVTAPNGCTATANVLMDVDDDVPVGIAEGAVLNCFNGQSATIDGQVNNPPGTTFNWSGPGIGVVTVNMPTVTLPGVYTFTMTSPAGCTQEIEVAVQLDITPPNVTALPSDQLDCSTTEVNINAGGTSTGPAFNYLWTTTNGNIVSGATTLNPLVDLAGIYQLLVSNTLNGCADSLPVTVIVDPAVPTGFDLGVRDIVCFGDTDGSINVNGVVGGTAPFNFTLTNSAGVVTNQYTGLTAGDYTLALLDGNGCELDTTITIGEPGQLVVELGPNVQVELGEEATVSVEIVHATPLQSVTWNYSPNCDSLAIYCEEFTYLPLNSYRHTITVVDSNGCVARDEVLVIVNKPRNIYVPNVFNPDSSDPDNSSVRIFMGTDVAFVHEWLIFDRWGDAVHQVQDILPGDASHAWNGKVRGDDGQLGVYVWYAVVEFIDGEIIEYKGDVTIAR
jgi:hypothetical protein